MSLSKYANTLKRQSSVSYLTQQNPNKVILENLISNISRRSLSSDEESLAAG